MNKFIINYHTGVKEEINVHNLDEAKKIAKEGISYTQKNVSIETIDGEIITSTSWFGVTPEDDDEILEQIGDYGFYQMWDDELGE
ncbi:hypothetical protein CN895_07740 [Bacillus cereus]|uniref:hypothetical protein n=1 Tax=Bacillus cereus TaxID=1396 RepID=UPI000BFCF1B5|nr:hypothetical protein [Bacillus cereus]PGK15231.1 hypothetical protein CN895_07740 [Bacillus cereus]